MNRLLLVTSCLLLVVSSFGQTVAQKLQAAYQQFEADSQLRHAISSLYVIDATTGEVVVDKNSQIGLAPASTQKIITSVTAFELLGRDFRFKTQIGYSGTIRNDSLIGDLFVKGTGDPTMGSWRYASTRDSAIFYDWASAISKVGIKKVTGYLNYNFMDWPSNSIPNGWIWQDIGNYYGASAQIINWHENQYDLFLRSGKEVGDPVEILGNNHHIINELHAAAKGTGDNAYLYLSSDDNLPVVAGTIPIGESNFKISVSDPYARNNFLLGLGLFFNQKGIRNAKPGTSLTTTRYYMDKEEISKRSVTWLSTYYSPSLDSVIYWFNKRSINLYGEALVKTFAFEKTGFASTDTGTNIVRKFWKGKGLDENELNIYDGSGLSPLNRVTTHAQVEILKYAKTKDWYPYFYDALPEFNNMKMKSGTISDVKGFCGYHKSKDGKEYIFSFLVNNYSGRSSLLVSKMYKVLDCLK